jgi:hypothetical protein
MNFEYYNYLVFYFGLNYFRERWIIHESFFYE